MQTIALFGDSVSKGVVFDEAKNKYIFIKDSFANLISAIKDMKILNFAKFGCTIGKAQMIIEKHENDAILADYTILEFGGNDSDFNWAQIAENPDRVHMPKTPIDVFADEYIRTIEKLRKKGAVPIMLNLPPIDEHKYFDWFSKGLNKENILKWLGGSVEYIYRWHEMYNMEICKIANTYNVPLIDIRSAFLGKRDFSAYLCADGIHPNENGHRLITETIEYSLPDIRKVLETN